MTTRRPGFFAASYLASHQSGPSNPGAHRYWRLNIPSTQVGGTGANDDFAVAEVSMHAFISGNDISGGLTYASSSTVGAGFEAAEAFDDDAITYLDTTNATNAWVSVDFGLGNDSEVHEITFTNVPNATRKAPAEIRIEYSDDNVLWFVAWVETPDPWTDIQETRTFTAGYAEAQYVTTNFATISANLTCVGAWGTLLRNHAYTGPALRVEDAGNPGTFVDIFFNGYGLIKEARPYGDDTRVITLYDQFGNSDLFAVLGDNITIRKPDNFFGTWLLDFNESGELTSTNVTDGMQPWELGSAVWACGFKRSDDDTTRLIWGIPANSNFMKMGIWHQSGDINWRINSGIPTDWSGTDWNIDSTIVQVDEIERAIGDMSDGSPAQAWYKGVDAGTRSYTSPITYDTGHPINMGGGIFSDYTGLVSELAIFDPSIPLSVGDKDLLDDALAEANFFVTGQEIIAFEQRAHAVLGTAPTSVSAKVHQAYTILGAPSDAIGVKRHTLFTILGNATDSLAARAQRLHVIVVP